MKAMCLGFNFYIDSKHLVQQTDTGCDIADWLCGTKLGHACWRRLQVVAGYESSSQALASKHVPRLSDAQKPGPYLLERLWLVQDQ